MPMPIIGETSLHKVVHSLRELWGKHTADDKARQGEITALQSDVTTLQSDVSALQGDVTTLQTDVADLQATQWERIARTVVAASTSQINIPLSNVYRAFRITIAGARWVTNAVGARLEVQLSDDGGSTFLTFSSVFVVSRAGTVTNGSSVAPNLLGTLTSTVNTSVDNHGTVEISGAEAAGDVHFQGHNGCEDGAGTYFYSSRTGAYTGASGPIDYIRLQTFNSNIDLGTIIVEGLRSP